VIRRDFLAILAGSPFVFGLKELVAQDAAPEKPDWFKAALKRMKETNRYGIVIVVPDDPKERERWGKALVDRYNEFDSEHHEPFGTVVLICVTSTVAPKVVNYDFKDPKPIFTPNWFLLRPNGRVLIGAQLKSGVLEDQRSFKLSFTELAYGQRDELLADQAKSIEKGLPESICKSADELLAVGKYDRKAAAVLLEKADETLPWIAWKCREAEAKDPSGERKVPGRVGLRQVMVEFWRNQSMKEADPCLPYGVKVEMLPAEDPCPPCGRGSISVGKARKFLSFYEK